MKKKVILATVGIVACVIVGMSTNETYSLAPAEVMHNEVVR